MTSTIGASIHQSYLWSTHKRMCSEKPLQQNSRWEPWKIFNNFCVKYSKSRKFKIWNNYAYKISSVVIFKDCRRVQYSGLTVTFAYPATFDSKCSISNDEHEAGTQIPQRTTVEFLIWKMWRIFRMKLNRQIMYLNWVAFLIFSGAIEDIW